MLLFIAGVVVGFVIASILTWFCWPNKERKRKQISEDSRRRK